MKRIPCFEYGSSDKVEYGILALATELEGFREGALALCQSVRTGSGDPEIAPGGEVLCDWLGAEPFVVLVFSVIDKGRSRRVMRCRGVRLRDLVPESRDRFAPVLSLWEDIGTALRAAELSTEGILEGHFPSPQVGMTREVPDRLRDWLRAEGRRAERLAEILLPLSANPRAAVCAPPPDRFLLALGFVSILECTEPNARISVATTARGRDVMKRPGPRLVFTPDAEPASSTPFRGAATESALIARALLSDASSGHWVRTPVQLRDSSTRLSAREEQQVEHQEVRMDWPRMALSTVILAIVTFLTVLGAFTLVDYVVSLVYFFRAA